MYVKRIPSLLSAAVILSGVAVAGSAWSQGREPQTQIPAHAAQATVPGSSPLVVVDARSLYAARIKSDDDRVPAHGATATIPGVTPVTPIQQ